MNSKKQSINPVSVIIPTYNRPKLTLQAVRSVLLQSEPPDEVIVVDDGSTNETRRMLESFGDQIMFIYQDNRGVAAARNHGIRKSANDWVAFLDSDDLWTVDKLALQRRALQSNPDYKICYTGEHWLRHGKSVNARKQRSKYNGWIYRQCLAACIVAASSVLVHKSVFDKVGLFDENLPACEDYELWLRIALHYPFLYLPHPCILKQLGRWPSLSQQYGLDQHRIQALSGLLNCQLTDQQARATRKTIVQKCRIYAEGCAKHQKPLEAKWAMTVACQFSESAEDLYNPFPEQDRTIIQ